MNHTPPPEHNLGQGVRKPGQWPVPRSAEEPEPEPEPEPDRRYIAAQARFHIVLGELRGALEEQPSPALVRAAFRRWIAAATQIADEVTRAMRDQNKEGGK